MFDFFKRYASILVNIKNLELFKESLLLFFKLTLTSNIEFGMVRLALSFLDHHGVRVFFGNIGDEATSDRCCTSN